MMIVWPIVVLCLVDQGTSQKVKKSSFPIDPVIFKRYSNGPSRFLANSTAVKDTGVDPKNATAADNKTAAVNSQEAEELVITLRDIELLTNYTQNIQAHINEKVLGDIENLLLVNKLEQSYQMYEAILGVLCNYLRNRPLLNRKAKYIRAITDFASDFVKEVDPLDMEVVLPEDNIEADIQNKMILSQLLEKLKANVDEYEESIVTGLNDKFKQISGVHNNATLSDSTKVKMLIDSCMDIVVFKKTVIDAKAEDIGTVKDLIIQNPQYKYLAYEYVPGETCAVGLVRSLWIVAAALAILLFAEII